MSPSPTAHWTCLCCQRATPRRHAGVEQQAAEHFRWSKWLRSRSFRKQNRLFSYSTTVYENFAGEYLQLIEPYADVSEIHSDIQVVESSRGFPFLRATKCFIRYVHTHVKPRRAWVTDVLAIQLHTCVTAMCMCVTAAQMRYGYVHEILVHACETNTRMWGRNVHTILIHAGDPAKCMRFWYLHVIAVSSCDTDTCMRYWYVHGIPVCAGGTAKCMRYLYVCDTGVHAILTILVDFKAISGFWTEELCS